MLAALRIDSLAIIESLEVRFERGLNVLTGETGAGKSILIDALQLLLGGRADPGVIRAGCEEAVVEGLFVGDGLAARARELGLPAAEDELLIRRTLSRGGRSKVHVNGSLATLSILATLTRGLVDLSGQHEHVSLLRRERHLDLLDDFGGSTGLRRRFEEAFSVLSHRIAERDALRRAEEEAARRRDYLAFQLREIDELEPEPGEEALLQEERQRLVGAERLQGAAQEVEDALVGGDDAMVDRLAQLVRRLEEAAAVDGRLAGLSEAAAGARAELEEVGRSLGRYAASIDGDPDRLEVVEERLEALRHLSRKHGGSLEEVLRRREEMRAELQGLERSEERMAELGQEIEESRRAALALAGQLTATRRKAAKALAGAVAPELARLGLESARLEVQLRAHERNAPDEAKGESLSSSRSGGGSALPSLPPSDAPAPGEEVGLGRRGAEEVEFLFCPNPGEEPKPLAKTASGGELSRVLLALKRALVQVDPVESYVFDEIDAGIGGATGVTVGRMLHEVARDRQVLCVTHLPQVAAFADVHLHVSKEVRGGRTHSRVEPLGDGVSRTRKLARMLAGSEGPAALAAAEELLARAPGAPPRPRKVRRPGKSLAA